MEKPVCGGCVHYRQHYTFDGQRIFRVYCGHCTLQKVRRKSPDARACDDFDMAVPLEEKFVSKEYLSKALLQHVLKMELLPEILQQEDPSEGQ